MLITKDTVEDATVDSDEDGFTLTLVGDFARTCAEHLATGGETIYLRLSQDAAVALNAAVRLHVAPWVDLRDEAQAEHRRGLSYLFPDDGADWRSVGADLARKADREDR